MLRRARKEVCKLSQKERIARGVGVQLDALRGRRGSVSISAMNEVMSYAQLERQFDSEWVLIEDPEVSPDLAVRSGTVVWHSKDRDEVYRKARELHPPHTAILFIGKLPEDMAVVL